MTLYNLEVHQPFPSATAIAAVLVEAIGHHGLPPSRRCLAAADSRSPDEGLALLNAYVAIADPKVRQAILDAVIAIGNGADR